jgi:hypothetical protein
VRYIPDECINRANFLIVDDTIALQLFADYRSLFLSYRLTGSNGKTIVKSGLIFFES